MTAIAPYILENLNTLIVVVNSDSRIDYVSPSVQRMLGFEPRQLLGDGWWDLTRSDESERRKVRAQIKTLIRQSPDIMPGSFERALVTSGGDTKWILWNLTRGPAGSLVSIGYDITERKLAEQKLEQKNRELQLKNAEMISSIEYAKRIQEAVLPEPAALKRYFDDAFIFYQPRDVVSGDFYWYYQRDNKIFVAAIDCTGHGVPGALMSVIANGLVRDVIVKRGMEDPAAILDAIDKEMVIALSREDGRSPAPDGMDIALCVFDTERSELLFAGAFRPLVRVRGAEVTEFKGNRYPIGFYPEIVKQFETTIIPYERGDSFYLFSDGITDQFGGENGKKLNRRRFMELLVQVQEMSMKEQESFLEYALNNWKQSEQQTDDILVIGLKV